MRLPRLVRPDINAIYSICAKVVEDLFKFDEETKDAIRKLLWQVADFCGVKIIEFCIMSNHFHVEAMVPPKDTEISDDDVIIRVGVLYGEEKKLELRQAVNTMRELGNEEGIRLLLAPYRARMHDLSQFMKTFMQRLTMQFNKAHKRTGTLWQGRFHSTLVDPSCLELVRRVAAYIALNPMRAGMVDFPDRYEWCFYGLVHRQDAAGERALEGLSFLYPGDTQEVFLEKYRQLLVARFARKGMNQKKEETASADLDFSERQPAMTRPRVIGDVGFVMASLGKLPKRGVTYLSGGWMAVGGERKRPA